MTNEQCPLCRTEMCHVTARGTDGALFLDRMVCLNCRHKRELLPRPPAEVSPA